MKLTEMTFDTQTHIYKHMHYPSETIQKIHHVGLGWFVFAVWADLNVYLTELHGPPNQHNTYIVCKEACKMCCVAHIWKQTQTIKK